MATIVGEGDTIAGTKRAIAMTTSEGEKRQLNIQNRIRLAICSELRRKILVALWDDKKALSELRKTVDASSTTAIHALRDLEKANLIYQDEARKYALTTIGEIITLKMVDFVDAVDVLQKHEEFWLDHNLSGIPQHMMERIGWLNDSMLISDTSTDLFKTHTTYLQILENANEVKGIYPFFHLEYLEMIEDLVRRKKCGVELIVTNDVLDSIVGMVETEVAFKKFLQEPNFTLFAIEEDIKIALTLTDNVFYLGMFAGSGIYDYSKALISDDKKAISWGRELHEHYRQRSKVVDLWT